MGSRAKTRMFGGKRFRYLGTSQYKNTAELRAKGLRKQGFNVRITLGPHYKRSLGGKGYALYTRKREKYKRRKGVKPARLFYIPRGPGTIE